MDNKDINNLMGGRRQNPKSKQIANDFGIEEKAVEIKIKEIKQETIEFNPKLLQFQTKIKTTLTLNPQTIKYLEDIENIIKNGKKSIKGGGLKSKLIDYVVFEYYKDLLGAEE